MKNILVSILFLCSFVAAAQKPVPADSLKSKVSIDVKAKKVVKKDTVKKEIFKQIIGLKPYTPQTYPKVVFYRGLIPGVGQMMVKKYWYLKLPIIYGAAVADIIFYKYNKTQYDTYKPLLQTAYSTGKAVTVELNGTNYELTSAQLEPAVNYYRKQKDLSIILFAIGTVVQAVEANVAAHFKNFDSSDDISIKFKPSVEPTFGSIAVGMGVQIGIGR